MQNGLCLPSLGVPAPPLGCPWAADPRVHPAGVSISFQAIMGAWGEGCRALPCELSWPNQVFGGLHPLLPPPPRESVTPFPFNDQHLLLPV